MLIYLGGVLLTTLVAGMATAPFEIFHFNRFAEYGLAAKVVAVPATALWVMPWATISFLLMPFGLEWLALVPMSWGLDVVVSVAIRSPHGPAPWHISPPCRLGD
jgi:competence protein ComEC